MNYTMQNGKKVTEEQAMEIITSAAQAFTLYTLKVLVGKADNTALNAIEGKNPELIEDLKQEAALYIIEGLNSGDIAFNDMLCINIELLNEDERLDALRLTFADGETKKQIFNGLRRYIYNTISKHTYATKLNKTTGKKETVKREFINIESDAAHQIASNNNIYDIMEFKAFASTLNDAQRAVWAAMQDGYKQAEICQICGISNGKASRLILSVKQALKDYYTA